MKLFPKQWQIEPLLSRFQHAFIGNNSLSSSIFLLIGLLLPSLFVATLLWIVHEQFWGIFTLLLWVIIATICFSHTQLRKTFKHYIASAKHGDIQACYHLSDELDCSLCHDAESEIDLGYRVGQSVAWLNYRHYGAVAIYLIALGPIGAVFYSTVKFYSDLSKRKSLDLPLVNALCFLLDWLPSRLFSFAYLLSGNFSHGIKAWLPLATNPIASARDIITQTAIASEILPEKSDAPVCIQSTLSLLTLTKRTFILLVTILSFLTIFGWVS